MSHDVHMPLTWTAAFVAGVASSAHCFGMCGGLAGALGLRARYGAQTVAQTYAHVVLAQAGRVSSYVLIGASCAALVNLGTNWVSSVAVQPITQALRLFSGGVLIALALRIACNWNPFASLERLGGTLWSQIAPLTLRSTRTTLTGSLLMGVVWGGLPCGLLYANFLLAAATGSVWRGALVMLAFGLGTLPAMLGSALLPTRWLEGMQTQHARQWLAILLAMFGVWTLLASSLGTHHH